MSDLKQMEMVSIKGGRNPTFFEDFFSGKSWIKKKRSKKSNKTYCGIGFSGVTKHSTVSKFLCFIEQPFESTPITITESIGSIVRFKHECSFETFHAGMIL